MVLDCDKETEAKFIDILKKAFNQESIMVEKQKVNISFS